MKIYQSHKGNCWDNDYAESFFDHFKNETIHPMKQKPENLKEVIEMV